MGEGGQDGKFKVPLQNLRERPGERETDFVSRTHVCVVSKQSVPATFLAEFGNKISQISKKYTKNFRQKIKLSVSIALLKDRVLICLMLFKFCFESV